MREPLIDFLAGALAFAYLVGALYFLRFWRATGDRLFLSFAVAFALFAGNQAAVALWAVGDEVSGYFYVLRVIGFLVMLFAIVRKNVKRI
jgi:hypothetical protein